MSLKKTDRIIDELADRLFIVEGEVTDLLTSETMQNLNASKQTATGAIAVGSALVGQIGNAALASFVASDEGIEVSDFAIEITESSNQKHYFKGCFPVVIFKKGDMVKVIAEPLSGQNKYARATAIIDQKSNYIWTGQEVVKGRMQYRFFGMKLGGGLGLGAVLIFSIFSLFSKYGIHLLLRYYIIITFFIFIFIFIFIGWRVGVSFDEQSVELEAILKKLGFNKPSMANLNDFSVFSMNIKNKIKRDEYPDRWEQYTYCLDLAKQYDEEKYGKK
ncbi:putative type VI secretion system effector [uncultured Acinetobacter sp.]|uniref:putative type VI secretion system effector n=1 Tax=uncultured Acinetobacter sp. TaxID=165433 RepID=UPI00258D1DA8|nr:putative type VI secretion system effector [uncultured Acinetobacter sp.]